MMAAQPAGFGLAKAGYRSHSPCPAVTKDQLFQLVLSNGWNNELSILALLNRAARSVYLGVFTAA